MRSSSIVSFPGEANLKKSYWGFVGFFLCRNQNALLSAPNNALVLATGIDLNNLCMVKLLRYTQETGMLEYQHIAYIQTEIAFSKRSTDHTFYCHPCSWNGTAKQSELAFILIADNILSHAETLYACGNTYNHLHFTLNSLKMQGK